MEGFTCTRRGDDGDVRKWPAPIGMFMGSVWGARKKGRPKAACMAIEFGGSWSEARTCIHAHDAVLDESAHGDGKLVPIQPNYDTTRFCRTQVCGRKDQVTFL